MKKESAVFLFTEIYQQYPERFVQVRLTVDYINKKFSTEVYPHGFNLDGINANNYKKNDAFLHAIGMANDFGKIEIGVTEVNRQV